MPDTAPKGWVLPEWPSLARRPLILGLPFGAAGALIIVVTIVGVVLHLFGAALVLLLALWSIGAALTRYDPWGWEIMIGAARLPRSLRAL
jgi:type IV secretory pathway VirB3-like protein